jgi:K+-transporting ATPase KdpF subunit
MNVGAIIAALSAIALVIYVIYTLLRPERF